MTRRHSQSPDTSHKPVKTNPKVPNVPATSYIPPKSKNRCLTKVHCIIGISSKISQIRIIHHQIPSKTRIRYNRVRKHQASMSASLGLARWHMQIMQISEFLHLLGHSSGSAVSWDVFRGDGTPWRFHGYFYGGVFSLGLGWGRFVGFFGIHFRFSVPATSAILNCPIRYRTLFEFQR